MSIFWHRYCGCAVLAVIFVAAAATAQSNDEGRTFQWKGKVSAENVVFIKNVNGDIHADLAAGEEAEVTAEKSGNHADEVKIQMVTLPDGVMFCAVYRGWFNDRCESAHFSGNSDHGPKVRYTVHLPENLRFVAENVNGEVVAENLGRFVKASSVNGSVRVSTKAWADISSVNGSLEAKMGRADWPGRLKLDSVNGSITVELPSDANIDVDFKSVNGKVRTEFPMTMDGSMGGRVVHGRIGSGGHELKVDTVNGNLELHRSSM